jgi:hypothetical protein
MNRRQRAEGRGRKAEGRRQKAEGGRQQDFPFVIFHIFPFVNLGQRLGESASIGK